MEQKIVIVIYAMIDSTDQQEGESERFWRESRGSHQAHISVLNQGLLDQIRVETTVQVMGIRRNTTNLDSAAKEGHTDEEELKTSRRGGAQSHRETEIGPNRREAPTHLRTAPPPKLIPDGPLSVVQGLGIDQSHRYHNWMLTSCRGIALAHLPIFALRLTFGSRTDG